MSRIFMSDEGFWCDRTKPCTQDGEIVPDGEEPKFWEQCEPDEVCEELEAELERLRDEFKWEVARRACIHENVRSGFGVQCSRCHAAATLMGLGWHSMVEKRHPREALEAGR